MRSRLAAFLVAMAILVAAASAAAMLLSAFKTTGPGYAEVTKRSAELASAALVDAVLLVAAWLLDRRRTT